MTKDLKKKFSNFKAQKQRSGEQSEERRETKNRNRIEHGKIDGPVKV